MLIFNIFTIILLCIVLQLATGIEIHILATIKLRVKEYLLLNCFKEAASETLYISLFTNSIL